MKPIRVKMNQAGSDGHVRWRAGEEGLFVESITSADGRPYAVVSLRRDGQFVMTMHLNLSRIITDSAADSEGGGK